MHDLHGGSPSRRRRRWFGVRPGEGRKIESLTLVLEGNTPRFRACPPTTMLTYRLAGDSGSDRDEQSHPRSRPRVRPASSRPHRRRESSWATVSLHRRLVAADLSFCSRGGPAVLNESSAVLST